MSIVVMSMTGFARAEGRIEAPVVFSWVWEAKSVNSKGLDVRLRLPHGLEALEVAVRTAVGRFFKRGTFTISLTMTSDLQTNDAGIDETILDALIKLSRQKAEQLGPKVIGKAVAPARLDALMAIAQSRGQVEGMTAEAKAARNDVLMEGLAEVLEALALTRSQEGAELASIVSGHLDTIACLCDDASRLAALQPEALKERLAGQVQELMNASPALPEEKLAQESALLALKFDTREELDRLTAHVVQARELLSKGEPCGRRLDFLCQEFNREANTLCSKSSDMALTRIGLNLRSTIDQLREQVQNIE